MRKKHSGFSFRRSAQSFQDNVRRAGPAAGASYTLIGAILLLGGIGYGVDQWQGTAPWGLFAGLVLGLIVGFYELAKVVWPINSQPVDLDKDGDLDVIGGSVAEIRMIFFEIDFTLRPCAQPLFFLPFKKICPD